MKKYVLSQNESVAPFFTCRSCSPGIPQIIVLSSDTLTGADNTDDVSVFQQWPIYIYICIQQQYLKPRLARLRDKPTLSISLQLLSGTAGNTLTPEELLLRPRSSFCCTSQVAAEGAAREPTCRMVAQG